MTEDELASRTRVGLRRLAKAVVIITSADEGGRYAMAATAVSELSLEPPSLLICVNRTASIHPVLAAGAPFAINILHISHEPICINCTGPTKGEERFSIGEWENGALGVPRLADAQASLVCRNEQRIDYATHSIFIGRVVEASSSETVEPLVYADGIYGRLATREPARNG